ncbi:MAG: LuxR C-terminal-related transcriptional regulator, partial [Leptospiraceae bacterium]|nr:LuxR C-terminal-related transcriptional regulator [Leptospiraceae bacterium]
PLSPRVARKILDDDNPNLAQNPLSERELEILNFIALGLNYRAIAEELEISPNTVRVHIGHIYQKLNTNNKVEALNRARQIGILE